MMIKRKWLIIALAVLCAACAAFAFGCADKKVSYTVTFMDGDKIVGQTQVEKGKKITEYPDAVREDENYIFDYWFTDEELTKVWNGEIERVTKNITLWANFLYVTAEPNNAQMTADAFSNTLSWLQRGIDGDTQFGIELYRGVKISEDGYYYEKSNAYKESGLSGNGGKITLENYRNHDGVYTVSWTPATIPAGGVYAVSINCNDTTVEVKNLSFKGAGTQTNPYLIMNGADLAEVTSNDIPEGTYYKLAKDITVSSVYGEISGKVFNGNFYGNGKTITLTVLSNGGIFGELGEKAELEGLTVASEVYTENGNETEAEVAVSYNCAGLIANINRGTISNCTVSANIKSGAGTVGTLEGGKDAIEGGAAGVAGINYGSIANCTYSGTIKANVGGSGIAVINNGTVSRCSFTGTLGAGNSVETGDNVNSLNSYSYMGGIAAVNYSRVEKSAVSGNGKLLAQRSENGTNDFVGGIVALNQAQATVSECYFDGTRVHGNRNVGGIAGANAGTIIYCYAGGAYHGGNAKCHSYAGGLENVGGIAGATLEGGKVSNCYATSNVYAYSGKAYKLAEKAENCVYLLENLDNRNGIAEVAASEENGCIRVIENDLSAYATASYKLNLDDTQLGVLNGAEEKFNKNGTLVCGGGAEQTVREITVIIDGQKITGASVSLKDYEPEEREGFYFAGWSLIKGGTAVFQPNDSLSYSDLQKFDATEVTLYPVFIEGEKPQTTVLSIAVYHDTFDPELAARLAEEFKAYCTANGIACTESNYVKLETKTQAEFSNAAMAGDYNIAIGFRANSFTDNILIKDIVIKGIATNRRVALLTDDAIAVEFYENFMETDEAKKILNPDYISEEEADKITVTLINGEEREVLTVSNATDAEKIKLTAPERDGFTFAGWALTEEAAEGEALLKGSYSYGELISYATDGALTLYARFVSDETKPDKNTVLHIAVYHDTFDPDLAAQLIEAFKAYCTENGLTCAEAAYVKLETTSQKEFSEEAMNGDYNIAIGFRANSFTDGILIKDIVIKGIATNRRVALLNGDALAVEFYNNFIESAAAKKILNPDYISEEEADKITVTLMNGETKFGELTVSNATEAGNNSITLPAPEQEGFEFKGWEASDGTLFNGSAGYADLKDKAAGGELTLTAKFEKTSEEDIAVIYIGYYSTSNYCKTAEAEEIKKNFEDYLTAKGYESFKVTLVEFKSAAVKNLVDDVQNSTPEIDCLIGGGNNITTTAGAESGNKLAIIGDKVSLSNLLSKDANRNAVRLTENELAAELMAYLQEANEAAGA